VVIVPDRFIFLETPRTASRSVAVTMEESVRFAKRSGCRHVKPKAVPRETGLPIWTITRNPIMHLYSWYKYGCEGKAFYVFNSDRSRILRFSEFADREFSPLSGFEPDCLNIYRDVADHFWPLEHGLSLFYEQLGITPKNTHFIGEIKDMNGFAEVCSSTQDLHIGKFTDRFKRDIALWHTTIAAMAV